MSVINVKIVIRASRVLVCITKIFFFLKAQNVNLCLFYNGLFFCSQALGKLNPQLAFQQGKLKIKGNIMLIQKLRGLMSFSKY